MKKRTDYLKKLVYVVFPVIIFITLILYSCKNNSKYDKSKLIPEKSFTSILSDIYLGGGMLSLGEIRTRFLMRDSIETYMDIIKSYGHTYDEMDNTLKYYFIKKPKRLLRIYDKILGNFSEMETYYENEPVEPPAMDANQWNGQPSYTFPVQEGADKPVFTKTLYSPITFTFEVTVTIFPDDPSVNPRLFFWYVNADSADTGKRTYISSLNYIKDGHSHVYSVTCQISEKHPVILHGSLFNYEDLGNEIYKHARISGIKFSFIGSPE